MTNEGIIYVNFETAKLAREKGFSWECRKFYNSKNKKSGHSRYGFVTNKRNSISRPSQSVLQRWLRDGHRINVLISYKPNVKKWDFITSDMNLNGTEWAKYYTKYYQDKMTRRYDSYELALEDALIEALNKVKL